MQTLKKRLAAQRQRILLKEATRMRRKGWSFAKIGFELGYTKQYIFYLLKKKGKE